MHTRFLAFALISLAALGCGGPVVVEQGPNHIDPYEACDDTTDVCTQGLSCLPSTLPAASNYTGELCTSGCNSDGDCAQDLSNFASICVNGQCYTQCPDGGVNCPYGTSCYEFSDQDGAPVDVCIP